MDRAEAFKTFQDVTADVMDIDAGEVTMGARFKEDLDVDSLAFVELTLALEEAYGVKIPETDDPMVLVSDAFDFVCTILTI